MPIPPPYIPQVQTPNIATMYLQGMMMKKEMDKQAADAEAAQATAQIRMREFDLKEQEFEHKQKQSEREAVVNEQLAKQFSAGNNRFGALAGQLALSGDRNAAVQMFKLGQDDKVADIVSGLASQYADAIESGQGEQFRSNLISQAGQETVESIVPSWLTQDQMVSRLRQIATKPEDATKGMTTTEEVDEFGNKINARRNAAGVKVWSSIKEKAEDTKDILSPGDRIIALEATGRKVTKASDLTKEEAKKFNALKAKLDPISARIADAINRTGGNANDPGASATEDEATNLAILKNKAQSPGATDEDKQKYREALKKKVK